MPTPDIFLTLKFGEKIFTDPRRISLLKAINQTGSLSRAAKLIGISYKTAWDAISEINQLADRPFVLTSTGGKGGGGTQLSAYAIRFIELYELLTKIQHNAFNILNDDTIPLNDILKVVAALSLQSSARNQIYGTIQSIHVNDIAGFVTVLLQDKTNEMTVYITHSSIERLNLTVGKNVILLIKAPQVELVHSVDENVYPAIIENINQSGSWCELELTLASGLKIYMSKPINELRKWNIEQGQQVYIYINPENIIVTTLV